MSARRPLLTAAAAGSLLCALWFVPSANATVETGGPSSSSGSSGAARNEAPSQPQPQPRTEAVPDEDLADTGSVDVTPYLAGGTAFLGLGVTLVTASARRTRAQAS